MMQTTSGRDENVTQSITLAQQAIRNMDAANVPVYVKDSLLDLLVAPKNLNLLEPEWDIRNNITINGFMILAAYADGPAKAKAAALDNMRKITGEQDPGKAQSEKMRILRKATLQFAAARGRSEECDKVARKFPVTIWQTVISTPGMYAGIANDIMNDFTLLAMLMVAHRIDELDAQTSTDKEVRRAATMCLLLRKNTGVVGGWADTIQAYQVRPTQHENGQLEFPQFATRK